MNRDENNLDLARVKILERHKRSGHTYEVCESRSGKNLNGRVAKNWDVEKKMLVMSKKFRDVSKKGECDCSPERIFWIVEGRINGIKHLQETDKNKKHGNR